MKIDNSRRNSVNITGDNNKIKNVSVSGNNKEPKSNEPKNNFLSSIIEGILNWFKGLIFRV